MTLTNFHAKIAKQKDSVNLYESANFIEAALGKPNGK